MPEGQTAPPPLPKWQPSFGKRNSTIIKLLGVGWLMQNGLYFATASFLAARGSALNRAPAIKTALRLGLPFGEALDAQQPFFQAHWLAGLSLGQSAQ